MGWRFRRSIKILPGIRLNFGKKGITSATVGRGLASLNINPKGVRSNHNIRGTGLTLQSKRVPFVSQDPSAQNQQRIAYWNCSACLQRNYDGENHCSHCGTFNVEPNWQFETYQPATGTTRNSWLMLGGILAGLFLLCGVCSVFTSIGTAPQNVPAKFESGPYKTPAPIVVPTSTPEINGKNNRSKKRSNSITPVPLITSPASNTERVTVPSQTRGFYILGPRGGCYYWNGSGRKTYVDHSFCR